MPTRGHPPILNRVPTSFCRVFLGWLWRVGDRQEALACGPSCPSGCGRRRGVRLGRAPGLVAVVGVLLGGGRLHVEVLQRTHARTHTRSVPVRSIERLACYHARVSRVSVRVQCLPAGRRWARTRGEQNWTSLVRCVSRVACGELCSRERLLCCVGRADRADERC